MQRKCSEITVIQNKSTEIANDHLFAVFRIFAFSMRTSLIVSSCLLPYRYEFNAPASPPECQVGMVHRLSQVRLYKMAHDKLRGVVQTASNCAKLRGPIGVRLLSDIEEKRI